MFAFCIESSHVRGLGHLYRSLTLANELRQRGEAVHFLLNDHASSIELIQKSGYAVSVVSFEDNVSAWEQRWLHDHPDVRVWLNDRLNTTEEHAIRVKAMGLRLVTLDDRGTGAPLSDANFAALVFDGTEQLMGKRVFTGVEYLLLDPSLKALRRRRTSDTELGPILVTMGGSDTWGITPRVMQELLKRGWCATIVLGPAFAHWELLNTVISMAPKDLFKIYKGGVPSLADEMAKHELAITGGGMTPFQANAIGLPCVVIANELFEIPVGKALEQLGGCVFAGFHADMNWAVLSHTLPISEMSQAGMDAIDLQGCCRVANELISLERGHA